jgi:hypothetical protein
MNPSFFTPLRRRIRAGADARFPASGKTRAHASNGVIAR